MVFRLCVNGKLLRLGLPGLRDELAQREIALPAVLAFFRGMARALSLVEGAAVMYAAQATALAIRAEDPRQRCDLLRLAAALEALPLRAPQSLLEAAQLAWLYALLTGTWNYGRMDVWLGSFLQRDLASGRLDEAAALRLLQSFWRLMTAYDNQYNNRVFLGGVGRPDEPAADAFALLHGVDFAENRHILQPFPREGFQVFGIPGILLTVLADLSLNFRVRCQFRCAIGRAVG